MKTLEKNTLKTLIKILMILPVTAILLLTISSCGNSKNGEETFNSIAPPPPPPPSSMVPDADSVYLNVDEMPVFTGGDTALINWVGRHTKYPEEAKKNNITGRIVVRFIVEKDGSVTMPTIVEGVNPQLDAEALRVTGSLPKFEKPAIVKGKPVAVHYMLPIAFRLK